MSPYARSMRRFAFVVLVVALAAVACKPKATTPSGAPVTTTAPPTASVKLTPINNVASAITMATRAGDNNLYVGTQAGRIYAIPKSEVAGSSSGRTLVLDISSLVKNGGEQGFLGMTFSADGTKLYVHYTSPAGHAPAPATTTVAEYSVSSAHPGVFGAATSGRIVFQNDHSAAANHNGGSLLLGPESKPGHDVLYLALGDGGNANDQGNGHLAGGNAQALGSATHPDDAVLGKILRIDPTPSGSLGYTIPSDNPFAAVTGDRGEIWSFGLRNPFRMSFDKSTGDLWIGDVGQDAREEVDFVAANDATHPSGKGANFGWNRREGLIAGPDNSDFNHAGGALIDPIFDIDHNHGDCAIIGGYVYRGSDIPGLVGQYLYTDNCNGKIRALTRTGATATNRDLGASVASPSSFGEDNGGELYVLSLANGVDRIDAP